MKEAIGANGLFYLLLVILPLSALMARRVPVLRLVGLLTIWVAIFGIGLVLVGHQK